MTKRFLLAAFILWQVTTWATIHTVTVSSFQFSPSSLTIAPGDTVLWNCIDGCHNVNGSTATFPANPSAFSSGSVACSPWTYSFKFTSTGTYNYQCDPHAGQMNGTITVALPVVIPNVWINEIHYDNNGTDTLEGYEIAGPAGTNLACYRVHRYSAAGGNAFYAIDTLSGTIANQACGFGTVWFLKAPLQNAIEGLVLAYEPQVTGCGVNNADTILQLLSYEGTFTASNGRAAGQSFTNIGVSESTATPVGHSLQLGGVGTAYNQFTWQTAQSNTYNAVNTNQFFCGAPQASYSFSTATKTVNEGDGTVIATYVKAANVALSTQTIQVAIKSGTGNAADINNYTTQTLSFTPGGVDSLPLNITLTDDAVAEGTENIVFVLRNPSANGAIATDSLFTLTITDNDVTPPSVAFAAATSSANENAGSVTIPITITNPNNNATSVTVSVMSGTATQGTDYSFSPNTITFPANSTTTQNVTVTITDDLISEGNETIVFMLSNPTNSATISGSGHHTLTIADNDGLQVSLFPTTQTQFENIGQVNVAVLLNNPSSNTTTVQLKLNAAGSSATKNIDFLFNDTTVTFAPNTSGGIVIPIQVIDDNVYEFSETIELRLSNATNGAVITDSVFLLTILNNDQLPTGNCSNLFFSEYIEGSASNKALEIFNPTNNIVDLSNYRLFKSMNGGSSSAVMDLSGNIAAKGTYVLVFNQADSLLKLIADTITPFLNFNGNDALALLNLNDTIDIIGQIGIDPGTNWPVAGGSTLDHTLIRDQYIFTGENNWANAAAQWQAQGIDVFDSLRNHTMAVCGSSPPVPQTVISFVNVTQTVAEKDTTVYVIVKSINPSGQTTNFTVALDNVASTATPGTNSNDFQFTNKNLTAPPGTKYDTIDIKIFNDNLIEQTETAVIRFVNVGANIVVDADSVHTTFITDNDALGVSFLGALLSYPEDAGTVPVKVVRSTPTNDTIVVSITKTTGSATNNADYFFNDTTITFYPNSNDTLDVWVTIVDDTIIEPNEQLNLNLTVLSGNAITNGPTGFTVMIIDNDLPIGLWNTTSAVNWNIYPNPCEQYLIVSSPTKIEQVYVTDVTGQTLLHQGNSSDMVLLDVQSLAAGVYFVSIETNMGIYTRRFVKSE